MSSIPDEIVQAELATINGIIDVTTSLCVPELDPRVKSTNCSQGLHMLPHWEQYPFPGHQQSDGCEPYQP